MSFHYPHAEVFVPAPSKIQKNKPDQSNLALSADQLRAVAHPTRLNILTLLTGGRVGVGEFVTRLNLRQSAVSQHLASLRKQGVVVPKRMGKQVYYEITPQIRDAIKVLLSVTVAASRTLR